MSLGRLRPGGNDVEAVNPSSAIFTAAEPGCGRGTKSNHSRSAADCCYRAADWNIGCIANGVITGLGA